MEVNEPSAKYLNTRFKRTEAGDIPTDWIDKPIKEIAEVTSGGTPNRQVAAFWDGDIPWITTAELDGGEIKKASQHITAAGLQNSAAKWLPAGTLLIALYGQGKTRGKCAVMRIAATTNQACAAIKLKESVDSDFVRHNLTHRYDYIRSLSNGGSQENLSGEIVKNIRVGMPSKLAEQRAIAGALTDADALIDSLEQLLAKKRQIKQGAMQELLTGKRRLPGFSGEWETTRIGDFTDCTAGGTPSTSVDGFWGGHIPWMSSGELHLKRVMDVDGRITEDGLKNSSTKWIPEYCVLIGLAGQGKTRGTVAMNLIPLCTNQSIAAIFPSETYVQEFLYHNLDFRYDELRELSAGDGGRGGLNLKIIRSLVVPKPSLDEQRAIAQVLSDMDADIAETEARLTKARDLKQAMAQALLTGRVRLVEGAAA